ncbi:MAG TPA: hypothetical protein VFQ88_11920 [Nevskiaceae bacterium]|nr:hypothetical protein [Nevskiaceae bacterium]
MTLRLRACLVASLALLLPALASAASPPVPALDCVQPTPPPVHGASAPQIVAYNQALPKYRACIQAYVKARGEDMKHYEALAQASSKAATDAVTSFNAFVKSVNDRH